MKSPKHPHSWPTLDVIRAIAFRTLCFWLMTLCAVYNESRAAPHLPDLLIDHIPYSALIDRYNYWLLLCAYLPINLVLLYKHPALFCRYNITSGYLSIIRGLCIIATGLGPVHGLDLNAGLTWLQMKSAFLDIVGLIHVFSSNNAAQIYLTKDLFFSGHTSITFLILLYVWPIKKLRLAALLGHLLVVLSVLFAHLHYTIDIVGAYSIAFSLFVLREVPLKSILNQYLSKRHLHHIALVSDDPEKLSDFYINVLGLKLQCIHYDDNQNIRSIWLYLNEPSQIPILMIERKDQTKLNSGFHLLSLSMNKNEKIITSQYLKEKNVNITHQSDYSLYFQDPEGNPIALSHYPHAAPSR